MDSLTNRHRRRESVNWKISQKANSQTEARKDIMMSQKRALSDSNIQLGTQKERIKAEAEARL